ncbi:hypothetical protein ACLOJK_036647 [Asimina triloba]
MVSDNDEATTHVYQRQGRSVRSKEVDRFHAFERFKSYVSDGFTGGGVRKMELPDLSLSTR